MNDSDVQGLRTLIVDDEESVRSVVKRVLAGMGVAAIDEAEDGEAALQALTGKEYDLVLADIRMPRMDGVTLLKETKKSFPDVDVLIMTSYHADYTYVDVVSAGAIDFIAKPFSIEELKAKVKRVARERYLFQELKEANRKLEEAYSDMLMMKDDEESRCRQINYERERLLAEQSRLKDKIASLEKR